MIYTDIALIGFTRHYENLDEFHGDSTSETGERKK
jgi:hypothetical protein